MDTKTERIERELEFQRQQAEQIRGVQATPPSIVERYRRNRHWRIFAKELIYRRMGDLRGMSVLDFGCGTGEITTQIALLGADRVMGFDLSPELLRVARRRAELDGVSDKVDLFVGDGEDVRLPQDTFDYVVLFALLHHTEVGPVLDQALAAAKPGGTVFIAEPVAFSTLLTRIRNATPVPKIVSPDERQLTLEEITTIRARFRESEIVYFNALGRLQRLLLGDPPTSASVVAQQLTRLLHYADRLLFSVAPGYWRAAGSVVIIGKK